MILIAAAAALLSGADIGIWGFLLLLGVLFIVCAAVKTFRPQKVDAKDSKKIKPKASFDGTSIYGLPQGETRCKVNVYDDCVAFAAGKQTSKLSMEKISSAYLKTKKELEGAKTGSIVAGAVFFGAIGAIVGSRVRRNDSYILIINYTDSGEPKAIAVAMEKWQRFEGEKAENFINKKAKKYQTETEIQL